MEDRAIGSFKTISMLYLSRLDLPTWVKGLVHLDMPNNWRYIIVDLKSTLFNYILKSIYANKLKKPKIDKELKDRITSFYKKMQELDKFYEQTNFKILYASCIPVSNNTFKET